MKKTRILMAVLMVVAVIGMFYQSAAAASDSCTSPDGYYCTYSLTVSGGAYANLTASKSSGVLANPLTAEIELTVISDVYPGGNIFRNKVPQFDNGTYITCNKSYSLWNDHVYEAAAVYKLNGHEIDTLYDI